MLGSNSSAGQATEAWGPYRPCGPFSGSISCFGFSCDKSRGFGGWPPLKSDFFLVVAMLRHRLDLFGHGPQKGAQFTGNGSVYHLSGFAFGCQSSEAAT